MITRIKWNETLPHRIEVSIVDEWTRPEDDGTGGSVVERVVDCNRHWNSLSTASNHLPNRNQLQAIDTGDDGKMKLARFEWFEVGHGVNQWWLFHQKVFLFKYQLRLNQWR
jgi:hypothetical protein